MILLLAIHNHQPVGNFEHVFRQAFKQCYWPLIEAISEFPEIKATLHHSGPLLDWAEVSEPDYIPTLVRLIKEGRVEPLGGGYYEPILLSIPQCDRISQIKMMQDFWRERAGVTPQGIWLTERVWDPSLIELLASQDIKYTILDDEHFRAAGIMDDPIRGYYLTERAGSPLAIFPSSQRLRYFIPFKFPEDVINTLLSYSGDTAVTYGDDGEKFGMWPGTHEWVVQKGWLKKLFSLLTEHKDKIKTSTLQHFYTSALPTGRVYLPTSSYFEMGEWALPVEATKRREEIKQFLADHGQLEKAKPFFRGGYWDNFLSKYPESNLMHKKMVYVSTRLAKARAKGLSDKKAETALLKSQCNCAYWHGLFGGLYLNYLRHEVYSNLAECENIIDRFESKGRPFLRCEKMDVDLDGREEIIMANQNLSIVLKDGQIAELTYRPARFNLQDTLARRLEAYHLNMKQEARSKKQEISSIHEIRKDFGTTDLRFDNHPRYSFIEHLWGPETTLHDIESGRVAEASFELTPSLPLPPSATVAFPPKAPVRRLCGGDPPLAEADRRGGGIGWGGARFTLKAANFSLTKSFSLEKEASALNVEYELNSEDGARRFATELNLTLLAANDDKRYYLLPDGRHPMMSEGETKELSRLTLVDEYTGFKLDISPSIPMDLWRYPVYTTSQSESGFDLIYQGSCIIWSFVVPRGKSGFDIKLEFGKI